MTELREIQISPLKVREAARDQFFSPGVRRAVVAHSDVAFGMARMYAIASEGMGQTIGVFREFSAAKAWLGVKDDALET